MLHRPSETRADAPHDACEASGASAFASSPGHDCHAAFLSTRDFPALDGLRAIAVAMTVAVHGGAHSSQLLSYVDASCGVPIFFVLSGFLITTLALREEAERGRLSLRAFYVRRAFRLFPLYYAMLGVYTAVVFGSGAPEALARRESMLSRLPFFLLYLNEYATFIGPSSTVFGHTWSLGIEEKFYLIWPVIAFGVCARRRSRRVVLATAAFFVFWGVYAVDRENVLFANAYGALMAGCVLALLLHEEHTFVRLRWLGSAWGRRTVLVGAVVFQLTPSLYEARRTVAYSVVVALVIAVLTVAESSVAKRLGSAGMRFVGQRSYAIYLVHVLVVHAVDHVPFLAGASEPWATLRYAASLAISLAVADVLRRSIELPCLRVGKRISDRVRTRPRGT